MSFWKKAWRIITWSPLKAAMDWLTPDVDVGSRGLDISRQGSDNALGVVYGRRRVGGVVVHKYVTGDSNEFLHFIVAYCHGPISNVETVYFNGIPSTDSQWGNSGSVQTRRGTATQNANSDAVNNIPNWNNDARGRNVCYGWHRFTQFKQEQVWRGEPEVTADIRGMEVYDWRTDTTGFSDNPAVCTVDYLTNKVYGRGLEMSELNMAEWTAAADFCDETTESQVERTVCTVEYNPPDYRPTQVCGTETVTISEPRYRLNTILDTDQTVFDNFRELLRSFQASPNRTNGLLGVSVETTGSPQVTFDEDDLVGSISYSSTGTNDRYNRVIIRFPNAETDFQRDEISYPDETTAAGQQLHQEWLDEDNGKELVGEFEFETFTTKSCAAQMAEIVCKRSRINRVVSFRARRLARLVLPNDIIGLTDAAFGWINKPVRIESRREVEPGVFEFEAVDHENAVYPWSGSSWSEQIGGTVLGNPALVPEPTNLQIANDETLATTGTLSWQIAGDAFIRRFDVTLTQNGTEIYDREEIGQSHTIPRLDVGSYVLTVRAVSTINRISAPAAIAFTLTQPVAPSQLNLSASNNTVTSEPFLAGAGLGTTFEFDLSDDPQHTPEGRIRARTGTFSGLIPSTEYTVWARTINALGVSGWVSDTIETTANALEIEEVLEYSPTIIDFGNRLQGIDTDLTGQAYEIVRNADLSDEQQAEALAELGDNVLVRYEQFGTNRAFAARIESAEIKLGPEGSLFEVITEQGVRFNELSATLGTGEITIAGLDSALSGAITSLQAADEDTLAQAEDQLNARIGYCVDSDGNPTGAETEEACLLASGNEWVTGAPLAESIRATRVQTADGEFASFTQIGQTYEDKDGQLIARGAVQTNVNGFVSGFVNTNDGTESNFDIITSNFRVGEDDNGTFIPSLYLNTATGNLTLAGDLEAAGGTFSGTVSAGTVIGSIIESSNYSAGSSGYRLSAGGDIDINGQTSGGSLRISNEIIQISEGGQTVALDPSSDNDMILWAGSSSISPSSRGRGNATFFIDKDGDYPRPLFNSSRFTMGWLSSTSAVQSVNISVPQVQGVYPVGSVRSAISCFIAQNQYTTNTSSNLYVRFRILSSGSPAQILGEAFYELSIGGVTAPRSGTTVTAYVNATSQVTLEAELFGSIGSGLAQFTITAERTTYPPQLQG